MLFDDLKKLNTYKKDCSESPLEVWDLSAFGNKIKIGRNAKQCEIVIDDFYVSKVHCIIYKVKINKSEILYVEDNNSTNGLIIDSLKKHKSWLGHYSIIELGYTNNLLLVVSGNYLKATDPSKQTKPTE